MLLIFYSKSSRGPHWIRSRAACGPRAVRLTPLHLLDEFVTMHNFMQSHKIVAKMTENVKWQKIVTLVQQNYDSNVTKLRRYMKKVAWIFLISWLCTIFRFSIILWRFCHKIVPSNVQVHNLRLLPFKWDFDTLANGYLYSSTWHAWWFNVEGLKMPYFSVTLNKNSARNLF